MADAHEPEVRCLCVCEYVCVFAWQGVCACVQVRVCQRTCAHCVGTHVSVRLELGDGMDFRYALSLR